MGYVIERRQAARPLGWPREVLDALLTTAPDAVVVMDEEWRIAWVNLAAEELFDYSAQEAQGQPFDFLVPAGFTEVDLRAGRLEATGRSRHGTILPLDIGLSKVTVGGRTLVTAIFRDATDRRQTEAALRDSEERFRGAFEGAAIGFALVGLDGRFRAVNRSLCQTLGYSEAELQSLSFQQITYPTDLESDLALVNRLLAGEIDGYHMEKRFLHRRGHPVWVLIAVWLVRDEHGAPQYFISQGTDITPQTEAEQALAQRAEELERSNAELEQFAYVASHDLQQPLRTVASYTELLAERYLGQLDERADRWITYVMGGVDRMQRLIDDLLALARVHTHGGAFVETDAAALVTRSWESVRQEHPIEATLRCSPLPVVTADAGQLEQLFQNLFDNALKYSRPDVPLKVLVSAVPAGKDPTVWEFAVQDNGIGLDMMYADRVFEIFQRLHHSDEYEGTGIGLAICRKIVERHGGRIRVDSAPGQGATFRFTLFGRAPE
jgi:PAS domain S-box-containing protein